MENASMAQVSVTKTQAEVVNGDARCVFGKTDAGWVPGWFYKGEKRMLRFKDHEWMSIGHLRPAMKKVAVTGEMALRFEGAMKFYGTGVKCSVVQWAGGGA